jgi:hypothetical protein
MLPNNSKLCIQCIWLKIERVDCDGPRWPTCENPATKSLDPPICFVQQDSRACSEFCAIPESEVAPAPLKAGYQSQGWVLDETRDRPW